MHEMAIIGMGCRFPGSNNVSELWANLLGGVDSVTAIPPDRFDAAATYSSQPGTPGRSISRHGGFLDDIFGFDAEFFGISTAEAAHMDPQQRLLLEVVWEALENAGIRPSTLRGSHTGVFVGQATSEYSEVTWDLADYNARTAAGSRMRSVTAGRVSQTFDLRGPSVVVDTACSSSLVAVHLGRQSLLAEESDLVIAAGVNVIVSPADAIAYSQWNVLAPDGRCKFGAENADGFVRSEGVGVVVLRRLADARARGERVLGIVLGSSVVNDGNGSGLLLRPAESGQHEMLTRACASAGISPSELHYVEAHGTGTQIGDEVEIKALGEAARRGRAEDRPLAVGSIKTNLGHTEAAAGIAGLIKTVLIGRHGVIPASLHADQLNPLLASGDLPLELVRRNRPLEHDGRPLLGVSSFGVSGTNAHVVVEGVPEDPAAHEESAEEGTGTPQLLVLSAASPEALRALALSFAGFLSDPDRGGRLPLRAICAAAALRRDRHALRLWALGRDHGELGDVLRDLAADEPNPDGGFGDAGFGGPKRTVFVFPGHGSQYRGMGRELLAGSAVFRAALERCDRVIEAETGWSLLDALSRDESEPLPVDVVQPMLWALEVGLAECWRALGVEADLCIGHSMGETAAAHVAGALSLEESGAVICRRSSLMRRLAGTGDMLYAALPWEDALSLAGSRNASIAVAAVNAPDSTVLAGPPEDIERLAGDLADRDVFFKHLRTGIASHSPAMDVLHEELMAALAHLRPGGARVPMVSTVTAGFLDGTEVDAAYWSDNLRRTVRFAEAVELALKEGETVFIEMSPRPSLVPSVARILADRRLPEAALSSLRHDDGSEAELIRSVGRHFALGGTVVWERFFGGDAAVVDLPGTVWRHDRHRVEPRNGTAAGIAVGPAALGAAGAELLSAVSRRITDLSSRPVRWLLDRLPGRHEPEPISPSQLLLEHSAAILGFQHGQLDERRPLIDQGLDSLMAIELSRRLRADLQSTVSPAALLSRRSVRSLADDLAVDAPARTAGVLSDPWPARTPTHSRSRIVESATRRSYEILFTRRHCN